MIFVKEIMIMKKLLVICLLLIPFTNLVAAEEVDEAVKKGCVLEYDENGEIVNLEEYEECISGLVEPAWGEDGKGPRQ